MTVEEAIKGIHTLTERISLADDRQDAIAMAIKSLEAWGKVKKEITIQSLFVNLMLCEIHGVMVNWQDFCSARI